MTNDSKLRVTRLITWLPVGGIERRLVAVLPRLAARGMDIRLICLREEGPLAGELRKAGVDVELIALRSRLDPLGIPRIAEALRRHRTQIVHAHMYRAMVPGTLAAKLAKCPVVFSQVHNVDTWESTRQKGMDRFLSRWRTGTICVSAAVQADVMRTLGLPAQRAPILYNGVDTELFRPDEGHRAKTRAEMETRGDKLIFLVPARLHPQKNPVGVLGAFAQAREETGVDAELWYAGGGPMQTELEGEIAERGLISDVRVLGSRDDMPAIYNAADCVVLSSFKEGFSNAVVEALACGRPVIAADVGGNREALDADNVGWVHAAGDMAALTRQFAQAMREGPLLAQRRHACRARGEFFSLDRLVDETERLYRDALAGASHR